MKQHMIIALVLLVSVGLGAPMLYPNYTAIDDIGLDEMEVWVKGEVVEIDDVTPDDLLGGVQLEVTFSDGETEMKTRYSYGLGAMMEPTHIVPEVGETYVFHLEINIGALFEIIDIEPASLITDWLRSI